MMDEHECEEMMKRMAESLQNNPIDGIISSMNAVVFCQKMMLKMCNDIDRRLKKLEKEKK